ncbi:MAG: hypothetical protein ACPG82_04820 [Porticoccaceae bacterium]
MAFFQLPSPDLSNLSLGGAVLRLLEAYGFTANEQDVVVRATYTDDGDPSFGLHYGVWLFDIESREYGINFNELIAGENNAREIDVLQIQTSGTSENLFAIALVETKGTGETRLVSLSNNEVVSNNLIHTVYGEELDIKVEDFLLSEDGRFLAIQTSSEQLAAENAPDTNDSSDIYLADLDNNSITRISYVGDSEVTDPTYLKDIDVNGNLVKVAFTTDAAFVSPSKIDINSTGVSTQANSKSDAYIWSSEFNDSGLSSSFSFELISMDYEGKASGFVDRDNNIKITNKGAIFTSSSENISENDLNESPDTFTIDNNDDLKRIEFEENELDSGSVFLSSSDNGRFISYLSISTEISAGTGAQQLVVYDQELGTTQVVSENGSLANNWVTGGVLSSSGYSIAFTSSADNLSDEPVAASAGGLFLSISEDIPIQNYTIDFDQNGEVDALTDGLILLRYLFNLKGNSLTDGVIAANSPLTPEQTEDYLVSAYHIADIDGNGNIDALTDGLLVLRYLFNIRGDALIDGATALNASRTTSEEIETFILSLMPGELSSQHQQFQSVFKSTQQGFSKPTDTDINHTADSFDNFLYENELVELLNFTMTEESVLFDENNWNLSAEANLVDLENSISNDESIINTDTVFNDFIA